MPEPSLGEILNIKVDPEIATGTPAVVNDNRQLISTLNQNAQYQSENNWRKYITFQNNLKEVYKNIGDVSEMETATADKPLLEKQAADIYGEILKDPRGVFTGGAKMAEVQQRLSKLKSDATESKLNRIYDFAHREYINRNPELNTDENKSVVDSYFKQPLGKRQPYMLNLPDIYDPQKLSNELNKISKNETPFSIVTPDSQFLESGTKISYDPKRYDELAEKMYDYPNERGVPIRNIWEKRFDKLPTEVKDYYKNIYPKDPAKAAYLEDIRARRMGNTIEQYSMKANTNFDSPLDKFKAETQRINANAAATRASATADLYKKKLSNMTHQDKVVKGFWDRVSNKTIDGSKYGVYGDVVNPDELPLGYRNINGLNTKGQPIELKPKVSVNGQNYYRVRYYDTDGQEINLRLQYDKSSLKGKRSYDEMRNQLLKNGKVTMELIGSNGVGNFDTALETARALSDKLAAGNEIPVFSDTDQAEPNNQPQD